VLVVVEGHLASLLEGVGLRYLVAETRWVGGHGLVAAVVVVNSGRLLEGVGFRHRFVVTHRASFSPSGVALAGGRRLGKDPGRMFEPPAPREDPFCPAPRDPPALGGSLSLPAPSTQALLP